MVRSGCWVHRKRSHRHRWNLLCDAIDILNKCPVTWIKKRWDWIDASAACCHSWWRCMFCFCFGNRTIFPDIVIVAVHLPTDLVYSFFPPAPHMRNAGEKNQQNRIHFLWRQNGFLVASGWFKHRSLGLIASAGCNVFR